MMRNNMNARVRTVIVMGFGCLLAGAGVAGQTTTAASALQWHDARDLEVEGKGWAETKHFYDRWPARAEGKVRGAVWSLGEDSAGMAVRFVTDATSISARWTLRREHLAMPHMPASGVSGVDLYVKAKGKWHWLGSGRPDKYPTEEKSVAAHMQTGRREDLLYLPLYNGVEEVKNGV